MEPEHPDKKPVRVTIFGLQYSLRSAGDPRETQQLAQEVDALMAAIASKTGSSDAARVAVLACLHLADRLRALERDLEEVKARVAEKSEQFSLLLDKALDE